MKLKVVYADKETRENSRIEMFDVPFKTKKISLQEADVCDTLAYRNCEDDEVVMGWKIVEEQGERK